MKLKKQFNEITLYFEILNFDNELQQESVLEDLIVSLTDIKLIYRTQPFDDLIKVQQQYPKHILTTFEPKPFDEVKLLISSIYNFLVETNQYRNFMIDNVELNYKNNAIVAYGTEGLLVGLDDKTTFSPLVRSCWRNPLLVEQILKK